jgi:hypothetical protein
MRRSQRLIAASVLIALASALAGCSSSLSNWDPSDLLDFLDTKKKLPGDRKPVFPDGVPGLEQGVPKELYKGNAERQQQIDQPNAQAAAAVPAAPPPAEEPKPERTAKSKGKGKQPATASTAPEQEPAAAPEENGSTAAAPPAPKPKKIVRRRTTAPPPDQTAAQPGQSAQPATASSPQQAGSGFPAPLPSGTFTR